MVKHALKQFPVDRLPFGRRELKGFLSQQFGYSCRYDIGLSACNLGVGALSTLFVISLYAFLSLIDADFPFNMFLRGIQEVGRSLQTVYGLKTDSGSPCLAFSSAQKIRRNGWILRIADGL